MERRDVSDSRTILFRDEIFVFVDGISKRFAKSRAISSNIRNDPKHV